MSINFNGTVLEQLPSPLDQLQRAYFYGDGLFETIRVFDGKILLLQLHWSRLVAGGQVLGLQFPGNWNAAYFNVEIQRMITGNARVRLTVWRAAGGLYRPSTDAAQFLVTTTPLKNAAFEWPENGVRLGVAEHLQLPMDQISTCKTLNASRYIAAARQAVANGWDDALLCNAQGRICEASASNIFWWENARLCTIPLSEGCVAGVLRHFLLETAASAGYVVQEKPATFATLEAASEIFLTNAIQGIVPVRELAGKQYGHHQTRILFDRLQARISNAL
jgi:branched-chain amino acid aminotransferase